MIKYEDINIQKIKTRSVVDGSESGNACGGSNTYYKVVMTYKKTNVSVEYETDSQNSGSEYLKAIKAIFDLSIKAEKYIQEQNERCEKLYGKRDNPSFEGRFKMYVNNNYQENHKCENCKNMDICKWCNDMKMKQEEVLKISVCKGLTPISINISCDSFEKKVNNSLPNYRTRTL